MADQDETKLEKLARGVWNAANDTALAEHDFVAGTVGVFNYVRQLSLEEAAEALDEEIERGGSRVTVEHCQALLRALAESSKP